MHISKHISNRDQMSSKSGQTTNRENSGARFAMTGALPHPSITSQDISSVRMLNNYRKKNRRSAEEATQDDRFL